MDTERIEQKFYLTPDRMTVGLALVQRTCRRSLDYADEQINSLYFDTPGLDFQESSKAGAFAKSKVRIRWYGTDHDPHLRHEEVEGTAPADDRVEVWLELKERRGFASSKQRKPTEVAAAALRPGAMSGGIVSATELTETMAGLGFFLPSRLSPAVAISYHRRRFVEPRTGFGVAFDSEIRCTSARKGIGRGERGLRLPGAVIEVKGSEVDLPFCLRELAAIGSSWTRFSKYSAGIDAHMSDLASVSRLWPSGRVHVEASTAVPTR